MTAATADNKPNPKPRTATPRTPIKGCTPGCICNCGNALCACHEKDNT